MSTVGATSSATAVQDPSANVSDTKKAQDAQDRFLTLLVTQMKNQDPLNPLDNAQVTSQLAQLSTVEGIDKLNASVGGLQTSYQTSQALQSASLIGHGVLVPGSGIDLTSGKSAFGIDVTQASDDVQVSVLDASNKVVHTVDLGAQPVGTVPLAWDGTDNAGKQLPDGHYKISVTATSGGKAVTGAVSALSFGQVNSVSSSAQGVKLNVQGLGAIDLSTVRQIL